MLDFTGPLEPVAIFFHLQTKQVGGKKMDGLRQGLDGLEPT